MRSGTPGFVGERLKAAREARGISSATGLSEMIGVSRAAVSQYECGTQTPSPVVMRAISEVLNLPIQHFLRPMDATEPTRFFRSMASATKAARARAAGKYVWLRDVIQVLKECVRFPEVDFPQLDLPSDPMKLSSEMIEDCATAVRRHWGLRDGPISNVAWLLENKGAVITRMDLEADTLDAFSAWGGREPHIILGTNKGTAARSRFNAAHELAHCVLHHHLDEKHLTVPATFREIENQADRFAGAFLLPRETFLNDLYAKSLDGMCALKPRWNASIALMLKRSQDLGAVSEGHAKSLWINLARRGWRRNEPLDESTAPEEPRFLQRCVAMLVERGSWRREEIPLRFNLPAGDLESLLNLHSPIAPEAEPEAESIQESVPTIIKFPFHGTG